MQAFLYILNLPFAFETANCGGLTKRWASFLELVVSSFVSFLIVPIALALSNISFRTLCPCKALTSTSLPCSYEGSNQLACFVNSQCLLHLRLWHKEINTLHIHHHYLRGDYEFNWIYNSTREWSRPRLIALLKHGPVNGSLHGKITNTGLQRCHMQIPQRELRLQPFFWSEILLRDLRSDDKQGTWRT